jgi:hypothetical protein
MRLLKLASCGELSYAEFADDNVPPYAILSHTWGQEDEEVTFKDLREDAGENKVGCTGYNKIHFCGKQAAYNGISYFWVDTCCIDKSSSAELSEAINSMFKWYHNADRCFVYLSDVSTDGWDTNADISQPQFESALRESRWFTRGWTLQELLAPSSVEFFSREGKRLGDKISLERQIYEITGIPLEAIHGAPLSQFTVEQRLSWAAKRTTKRKEDEAYCLLGIFDIFMPLLYGEGKENAFVRLQKAIDEPLSEPISIFINMSVAV